MYKYIIIDDEDIIRKGTIKKLEKQEFKIIRESFASDVYMSNINKEITNENINKILNNCVMIRKLEQDGKMVLKRITRKFKEFDETKNLVGEKALKLDCDDLETARKIFESLNFKEIVQVKYHNIVMKKENIELCFQDVENLGVLIEMENEKDFSNNTTEEINKVKDKMFNYIKNLGLNITEERDVRKAYNLIKKSLNN